MGGQGSGSCTKFFATHYDARHLHLGRQKTWSSGLNWKTCCNFGVPQRESLGSGRSSASERSTNCPPTCSDTISHPESAWTMKTCLDQHIAATPELQAQWILLNYRDLSRTTPRAHAKSLCSSCTGHRYLACHDVLSLEEGCLQSHRFPLQEASKAATKIMEAAGCGSLASGGVTVEAACGPRYLASANRCCHGIFRKLCHALPRGNHRST